MLVDTGVWLDLAKDSTGRSLLGTLDELVSTDDIILVVGRAILDEFAQNKARLIEDSERSISSSRRRAKAAEDRNVEIDHRLVNLREQVADAVALIERLLAAGELHETTDPIKVRASQRGIEKRAPFHRQRNGMVDAIVAETYADIVAANKSAQRFAFVTHNVKDFSLPGDPKLPHPDLADLFADSRSRYFITLGEALRSIRPDQLMDLIIEEEQKDQPRRKIAQVVAAEHEFFEKVWYHRHTLWREKVELGNIIIVDSQAIAVEDRGRFIPRDVWEAAVRAAEKVERRYGSENLGPWSDFEWGMINGKLSTLRWVLGDEWDMLT
jgi:hypothetical protein